ncbi:mechanosensitive ion channel domain-containing protein [Zavarzinia sp. CC-PAN008]|uniref:mechanosensitive ion channel domain-containing protein n=1 Tax=Zavarzinia sp. CC-PAN008 TaxID=3243332 RepID=UPI003F748FFE
MHFVARVLILVAILVTPAAAQVPGLQPAQAENAASENAAARSTAVDELIRVLEDEGARAELLARLRAGDGAAPVPQATRDEVEPTVARQIADYTRTVAESGAAAIGAVGTIAGEGRAALQRAQAAGLDPVALGLANLAGLALALLLARLMLGRVVRVARHALGRHAQGRGVVVLAIGIIGALTLDVAGIVLAWVAGYGVSLYLLTGPVGVMSIDHALLLNAFLVVELVKVALRVLLSPRELALRLPPMSDTTAAYWYFWGARLIGLVGYTFMFAAPVVAGHVGPATAQALRATAMIAATILAIVLVLRNREPVRKAMQSRAGHGRSDPLSRALAFLGTYWHVVAIAYLLAILVVWLANPAGALPFMLAASAQSVLAVAIGALAITLISRAMRAGVRLPASTRERLPLLEARLLAVVPRVMQVIRTLVLIAVVVAIAHVWGLVDMQAWLASEAGRQVIYAVISAGLILLVGYVLYLVMSSWVEYRLNPNFGTVPTAREKTLLALGRNAFTVVLAVFVIMLALAQLGINIGPLLAGAGVLGLAIGFGAQKFVEDIITGVFIQLENVMNEGDVVEAGGKSGVVERLTIRSVSIRSLDGTVHLVPFSSVGLVSNMMKGFSYHVAEIGVAYRENIAEVKDAMREAFDLLMATDAKDNILEPLDIQGVTALGDSAVTVRARIKTVAGKQWGIGRTFNELIKDVFDRRGIEIPFPHITLYMGEDKAGRAPPLNLRLPGPPEAQGG